ncbi:MAG: PVC-type heme-binding CxxCH protein, partial [Burkholderiales bacterium]
MMRYLAVATIVVVASLSLFAQSRPQTTQRTAAARESDARPVRVLLLGDGRAAPHSSAAMYQQLAPALARRGIQLTHVLTPEEALTPAKLAHYDALMIYGNHPTVTPEQEKALLSFVEGGKGVIAIHSAANMFTTSAAYASLIGAQQGQPAASPTELTPEIVQAGHPIMQGLKPFATWDETGAYTRHNAAGRTVLMERAGPQGREPWTWVRTEGTGRVFYTGYGHDERTWGNPAFHKLIEQGTVWALEEPVRRAWVELKMPEVAYVDTFIVPNYENRDPAPKYQLPFTPDESMKFIQVPAEFRLELFASEPDITQPIAFNFDERGRLWIIEAVNYPNVVLNGAPGDDRIKILEDTNGDGRADKFTVFADHLNLPTSLVFANGGIVVAAAPHMLFLKDTNGDDKADVRQVLSTGWGIRDTHAGPSNLMYGPDNYIWGTVGYSGFQGEMNGKPMQFGQGMYKFRPDGSGFEYVTGSTNNTWGLGMSETFDVFGSTANNDPSFYVAIPNRYFDGIEGLPMPPGGGRGVGAGYQSAAQFYNAHHLT